jgi:hypothetical protein
MPNPPRYPAYLTTRSAKASKIRDVYRTRLVNVLNVKGLGILQPSGTSRSEDPATNLFSWPIDLCVGDENVLAKRLVAQRLASFCSRVLTS